MADPATTLIIGLLVVGAAGIISGLTGFGFALVASPLLIIVLPPKVVVPIVALLSMLSHLVVLAETLPWIRLKRIWLLTLAAMAGAPLGTYLLVTLDADALKTFIGVVTTLSALAMLLGFKRPIENERLASVPIGLASGILGGSTGMSGPPVVLFFSNQGIDKHIFRANLNLYFTLLACVTLPLQVAAGLMTTKILTYSAWFFPALLLGTLAGMRLARRVDETAFRRLTLVVVIAAGLSAIASAMMG
jgi:uncharacterized membrane protein YfcA